MAQWTTTNNVALNYDKTKEMCIYFKKETPDIPPITINDIQIEQVHSTRLLGVTISQDLTWQLHIDDITTKASQRLYFIILLKRKGENVNEKGHAHYILWNALLRRHRYCENTNAGRPERGAVQILVRDDAANQPQAAPPPAAPQDM